MQKAYDIHSDTDGAAQHNNCYAVQHHERHYEYDKLAHVEDAVALCIKLSISLPLTQQQRPCGPPCDPLWHKHRGHRRAVVA